MSTLGVIAEEEGECWPSKQAAGEFGRADAPADWHRVMSGLLELLPADVQDANAALVSQAKGLLRKASGRRMAPVPTMDDTLPAELEALKNLDLLLCSTDLPATHRRIPRDMQVSDFRFGMLIADADPAFKSKEVLGALSGGQHHDIWLQGCMAHVYLHHDKHKSLLVNLPAEAARRDIRTALQCCTQPCQAPVMEGLLDAAWQKEPRYAQSMRTYITSAGGLQPRCIANALYRHSLPDHQQSTESGHHTRRHIVGNPMQGGVRQLNTIAATVSCMSVMQHGSWTCATLHKDVFCGPFFRTVYSAMRLEMSVHRKPVLVLNVAECAIQVDDFDLEVCDGSTADDCNMLEEDGAVMGRRVGQHMTRRRCSVILMPSAETLAEMYELRNGNVRSATHARQVLTSDSNKGKNGQSWVSMFRAVVETPVQAQEEHQMDLATFAQWSTAFSVLVPVSRDVPASAGDRAQLRAHAKTLPLLLCAMSVCREDCA